MAKIQKNIDIIKQAAAEKQGDGDVEATLSWEPRIKFMVAYDEDKAQDFNPIGRTSDDVVVMTVSDDDDD